jgi:hypothetical protein
MSGGPRALFVLPLVALLVIGSIALQVVRDRKFGTDRPAEQVLYVQSPEVVKRLALSYQAVAADIYWIRALQAFGGGRLHQGVQREVRFKLLYPLLDMATALDPYFNIAYRFGAIFLSEPPPGGPGQADQAIALLKKGLEVQPNKWQYMQDAGFVEYWSRHDYKAAADWFERGSRLPGAAWFLKPLAATTLAQGGQRAASRLLFQAIAESGEHEWMRKDAQRRLRQLDALDAIERLQAIVDAYTARGGTAPYSWPQLVNAGLLRGVPIDAEGVNFDLGAGTGTVALGARSPLAPLPAEPPGQPPVPGS